MINILDQKTKENINEIFLPFKCYLIILMFVNVMILYYINKIVSILLKENI